MNVRIALFLAAVSFSLPVLLASDAIENDTSNWELLSGLLFREASAGFAKEIESSSANSREARLGAALARLGKQPRRSEDVMLARQELELLIAEDSKDRSGILAQWALARVLDRHVDPPEPDHASVLYRNLLESHQGNAIAEMAASALVMNQIYSAKSEEDRATRFRDLEEVGGMLKTSAGRRDYHLAMGSAYVDFRGDPQLAIRHFLAADSEGISRWQNQAETWLAIIELATVAGREDLVNEYGGRFLEKFQRSANRDIVKERMQQLRGEQPR